MAELLYLIGWLIVGGFIGVLAIVLMFGVTIRLVSNEEAAQKAREAYTNKHPALVKKNRSAVLETERGPRVRRWKGQKSPSTNQPWSEGNTGYCGGNPPGGTLYRPGSKVSNW